MEAIDFSKTISKTSYSRGAQCLKYIWLHKNSPELKNNSTAEGKLLKEAGNPIVDLYFSLFPDGLECGKNQIEEEKNWPFSISKTQEFIAAKAKTLFNPAFYSEGLLCDVHILERKDNGTYRAGIIKISTKISDRSLNEAAFQLTVLELSGIGIEDFDFILINNKYVRKREIQPKKLFRKVSVIQKIRGLQKGVIQEINEIRRILKIPIHPNIKIGPHCTEPRSCSYKNYCWKNVPDNSIFELVGFPKESMFNFWAKGYKTIQKIPSSTTLSFNQDIQRKNSKHINKKSLKHFISEIKYPVFLVDFEGFLPAIPQLENTHPFEMIPFLYSGIFIETESAEPVIKYHLCKPTNDILSDFLEHFVHDAHNAKTLLCYDTLTEKNVLKNLAKRFPDQREALLSLIERLIDLSIPIKRKDFYLPKMKGFVSLKYVLPAINPEMGYGDLGIQTGRMAANAYQLLYTDPNRSDKSELEKDLLEYCQKDASALLNLFRAMLKEIS